MLGIYLLGCQQEESNSDVSLTIQCEKESESSFDASFSVYAIAAMNRTKIAVVDSCADETIDHVYWHNGASFELITKEEKSGLAIYKRTNEGEQLLVAYKENKFVFHWLGIN